jgi:hypothetical protein
MIRGDAHLKVRHYMRANGKPGVGCQFRLALVQFRLALVDLEALNRTAAYLAEEGVDTTRFDFSSATETRKAMVAIRAQRASSIGRIVELIEWPSHPSSEWNRGYLAVLTRDVGRGRATTRSD